MNERESWFAALERERKGGKDLFLQVAHGLCESSVDKANKKPSVRGTS